MLQNLSSIVESIFKEKRLLAGKLSIVQYISEVMHSVENFQGFLESHNISMFLGTQERGVHTKLYEFGKK